MVDTSERNIRFTGHAKTQSEGSINLTVAKALRLASEYQMAGRPACTVEIPFVGRLYLFNFLLHLERSLASSGRLADIYCREIRARDMMPEELKGARSFQDVSFYLPSLPKSLSKTFPRTFKNFSRGKQRQEKLRL